MGKKRVETLFSLGHGAITVSPADYLGQLCISANGITLITQTRTHYFPTGELLIPEQLCGINQPQRGYLTIHQASQ